MFDAVKNELIKAYNLRATANQMRRAAHQAADLIYQALEGIRGDFSSRIAYITTNLLADNRERITLNIADGSKVDCSLMFNGVLLHKLTQLIK